MPLLGKLLPDVFTVLLVTVVVIASLVPATGWGASVFSLFTILAIAILFFLHGARIPSDDLIAGATYWRLHVLIIACTFFVFPVVGVIGATLFTNMLDTHLWRGILFLCALPSTVQSSIAFTSLAKGNISAAIFAATASNVLGIFVSPLLIYFMLSAHGDVGSLRTVLHIALQFLLPFALGHGLRPWIGVSVFKNRWLLSYIDQGSILLVVYTVFSAAVIGGVWKKLPLSEIMVLFIACCILLFIVMAVTVIVSRVFKFNRADAITILFCGSKKSLASGAPLASILFVGQEAGIIIVPMMIFHQVQLIVCAWLARYFSSAYSRM